MEIDVIAVGPMGANCYLVWKQKEAAVLIDPGADADKISRRLEEKGLMPCAVLLTHGHFDHAGAVAALKEKYPLEVVIGAEDEEMPGNPQQDASALVGGQVALFSIGRTVVDGERFMLGGIEFEALHTPGHTRGSMVYRSGGALFTGDTLFAGSVGRTDFYGGDFRALSASLRRLAGLEGDYRVFPGHGPETTLEAERRTNPFLEE